MGLKEVILNFMKEEAYKPMEIPEIAKIFNIKQCCNNQNCECK